MSQYTPEQVEAIAASVAAAWTKSDPLVREKRCKQAATILRAYAATLRQQAVGVDEARPNDDAGAEWVLKHHLFVYEVDFGDEGKGRYVRLGDFNKVVAQLEAALARHGQPEGTVQGIRADMEGLRDKLGATLGAMEQRMHELHGQQGEEGAVIEVTDSAGKFVYLVPDVLPAGTRLYTRPAARARVPAEWRDAIQRVRDTRDAYRRAGSGRHCDRMAEHVEAIDALCALIAAAPSAESANRKREHDHDCNLNMAAPERVLRGCDCGANSAESGEVGNG